MVMKREDFSSLFLYSYIFSSIKLINENIHANNFNAKVGREDIFRPTIGKFSKKIVTKMGLD